MFDYPAKETKQEEKGPRGLWDSELILGCSLCVVFMGSFKSSQVGKLDVEAGLDGVIGNSRVRGRKWDNAGDDNWE